MADHAENQRLSTDARENSKEGDGAPPVRAADDEATMTDTPQSTLTTLQINSLMASLALACFLILLDASVISTAIPKITDEFHSLLDVGWYGNSYQLGSAALQPLTGKLYTNFPLKWTFLSFFFIFEVGSALCGASQSSAMLIISRTIAGMGASGIINGCLIILAVVVPLSQRAQMMGIVMSISQLGIVIGPLIGGAFTTGYTWRWSFYINLPLGLLILPALLLLKIPEQSPNKDHPMVVLRSLHKRVDWVGFVLLAGVAVQLLLALQLGGSSSAYTWRSSEVIGTFVGAGATLVAWGLWNARLERLWKREQEARRQREAGESAGELAGELAGEGGEMSTRGKWFFSKPPPLLSFDVIRRRAVWVSAVCHIAMMAAVFGNSYFLPLYFQGVLGVNAVMSGVYMLAGILPQMLFGVMGAMMVPRIGYIPPFVIVGGIIVTIGNGLYSLLQPGTPTGHWVGFQILAGVGRGIAFQMPFLIIQHHSSLAELPDSTTFLVFCQYMGPAVFLSVFNVVFDSSLRSRIHSNLPTVDAEAVIGAGATGFRKIISAADLPAMLHIYADSLDVVFYLVAGGSALLVLAGLGLNWKNVKNVPDKKKDEEKDKERIDTAVASRSESE